MTDLSQVPTEQLLAAYNQQQPDLSSMSTEQLLAAYNQKPPPSALTPPNPNKAELTPEALLAAGQRRQTGEEAPLTWGQVGSQAVQNLPGSAYQFGSDLVQPILHPIQTATNILDLGNGIAQMMGVTSGTEDIGKAKAVGQYFVDRYGSMEGFKKALASDPVGVMGDISTVFTGGETALARLPGVASKAAKVARVGALATDPLTYAVRAPAAAAFKTAETLAGPLTGVGPEAIRTARVAAKESVEGSQAVRDQMRGRVEPADIVADANAAADAMRRSAQASYRSDMRALARDKTVLSFKDIDQAVRDMSDVATFEGIPISRSTDAIRNRIINEIDFWKAQDPARYHTPEGLDALKKSISDITNNVPFENKQARLVIKQATDAVKNTIMAQAPGYAKTMANYARFSDKLDEIQRTLGVASRATTDTALRKLTSIMRNNVNTNFGQRARLAEELQAAGAPHLRNKIAGASLNTLTPRGLAGVPAGGGLLGILATAIPSGGSSLAMLPALAATSPRIVGETARGLGALQRRFARAAPYINPARSFTGASNQ